MPSSRDKKKIVKEKVSGKPRFSGITLELPENPTLLAAAGRVALAHAHLEYAMKRAFGTLTGIGLRNALITTNKMSVSQLRDTLRALANDYEPIDEEKRELKRIFGAAERLSSRRNKLIHRAWASTEDGNLSVKGDDHRWGPAPTLLELNSLANELVDLAHELTTARLTGVFKELARRMN
jgi:hypothetical protein